MKLKMNLLHRRTLVAGTVAALALGGANLAISHAQDDRLATPSEQRMQDRLEDARVDGLRNTLRKLGYEDKDLLNAVSDYVRKRDATRLPFLLASRRLEAVLQDKDASNDEVHDALNHFYDAADAERHRRDGYRDAQHDAEKQLDDNIHFSHDPRLEATLVMMGVLGDDTELLDQAAPGFEAAVTQPERRAYPSGGGESRRYPGGGFPGGGVGRFPRY